MASVSDSKLEVGGVCDARPRRERLRCYVLWHTWSQTLRTDAERESALLKLNRHIYRLAVSALVATGACTPTPAPVSQSMRDPSNPSAPEGVAPTIAPSTASTAAPADSVSSMVHDHDGGHAGHGAAQPSASASTGSAKPAQSVSYVCPMHPEVTSSSPGLCPKCNMKLVPKK